MQLHVTPLPLVCAVQVPPLRHGLFAQLVRFTRGVVVTAGARELEDVVVPGVVVLACALELVGVTTRTVVAAAGARELVQYSAFTQHVSLFQLLHICPLHAVPT